MKKASQLALSCLAACSCHADLIAHWPLDTDATDATGNGFDGAVVNGTVNFGQTGANANTGSAAAFPDLGNIDVPFDAALNPESFTVTMWVNPSTLPSGAPSHFSPITNRDDVGPAVSTHGFILYLNPAGTWDFWTGDGDTGWDSLAGDAAVTSTWTHLAISYDATTDTKTLWVNGVASATDNIPQSGPTQYSPNGTGESENLHLGSGGDAGNEFQFDGLIDDVGLWDGVLNEAVIQSVMDNGVAGGQPDPFISADTVVTYTLAGTPQQYTIPIANDGSTQTLNVSGATFNGDPNFSVTTLPGPIAPGETGDLVITFDPLGANGAFEGTVAITSDDPLTPTQNVIVRGSVQDPLIVSDSVLDLGSNTSGTLTISNNGATRPLNITAYNITGPSADKFDTDATPGQIPAGGSQMINVTFDAGGDEGAFSASLEIASDDPLNPSITVTLLASVAITNPLVAWWPLDADGTDASGNGFDGTITGSPVQSEGANENTSGALTFDGASRIDVPFDPALNPTSFTVTLWTNASTTAGFASPITSRDDVSGGVSTHGYILYNDNGGNWNFWTGDGNPGWNTLSGGGVTLDTWTHLALSYDAETETKTIYVDGVEANQSVAANQYSPNGTVEMEALHIGAGQDDGQNFWFVGAIDDIGLFRTALSVEEINTIKDNGVAGFTGAGSVPEIIDLAFGPGDGEISVTFTSVEGAKYIIERSPDLGSPGPWDQLDDEFDGEAGTTTFIDRSVPDGSTKLFYRVQRK